MSPNETTSPTETAIPASPREVRWKFLLQERRALGVAGLVLTMLGSLATALGLATGRLQLPLDDYALDSGSLQARANVHTVEPSSANQILQQRVRHAFTFAADNGRTVHGESWSEQPACEQGGVRMVEYLPGEPNVSRIVGTKCSKTPTWLMVSLLATLAAGFVLVLVWLRYLVRLRIALSEGRLTSARVLSLAPASASRWAVAYQFTDPDGNPRRGEQRLRLRDAPAVGGLHPVIHDDRNYELHRLVVATDFVTS